MKADKKYQEASNKIQEKSLELFATTALQTINGLTQSITGYFDTVTGKYCKAIDSEKLSDYATNNIMPNFLTSSAKLFGQMVGGAKGASACGMLMSLGLGIGKFCKA